MVELEQSVTELWDQRDELSPADHEARTLIESVIEQLDRGELRAAELSAGGEVVVHEWVKQAILLLFRVREMTVAEVGPFEFVDKLPLKSGLAAARVRAVPGASARWGSFLGRGVVLMPSYVNIGARIGEGTMVDTWATVGTCAQIGANVHLSGGVGIGGVLEPPQAAPVVIEDDVMIGSRCMIVEGARVGEGAVLGAGAILSASIPVIDAETGEELSRGHVPPWCVAVSATRQRDFGGGTFGLPCVLVIKRLSEGDRHDKSALQDVLRSHGSTV